MTYRLLAIALASAILVAAIEVLEFLLSSSHPGWVAHFLTISLVTLTIVVAGYLALRRVESLDRQLRQELLDRTAAAEALRESEERHRIFAELASDFVYSCEVQLNALFPQWVTEAFEKVSGYPLDELRLPGAWRILIHPEDQTRALGFENDLRGGQGGVLEYRIRTKSGEVRWLRDYAKPIWDAQQKKVVRLIGGVRDITVRRQAEEALRASEERFRSLFERHNAIMLLIDPNSGAIVDANRASEGFYGYTRSQLCSMSISDINTLPPEEIAQERQNALEEKRNYFVFPHKLATGEMRTVEVHSSPISVNGRSLLFSILHDVTDRKQLESQLLQSQKMESIGRLAGGVAHDFNNLLTGILGYAGLGLMELPPSSPIHGYLLHIRDVSQQAAGLARQLLAFARRQIIEPKIVNLNELILRMENLLRRIIGEDIQLLTKPGLGLGNVKSDIGQLEQVLLNLAVNARDAMPGGGTLTLETANAELDEDYASRHAEVEPGHYVMMSVTDTGTGMSQKVMEHLFEPFFTTKEPGKGTGLGLATCYGIIRQSGGHIWVSSELGAGSSFQIYLPRVDAPAEGPASDRSPQLLRGRGTVLLTEDEPLVRSIAMKVLERQGFLVLEAESGAQALEVAQAYDGEIHLLLTDVVMPQMGGRALAERLLTRWPRLRVLFMSGYTDDDIVQHGVLAEGLHFLQKPFTPEGLLQKVHEVLGAPSP